jgi:transposase
MVPAAAVGHERKTARRKAKPDRGIEIEAEGVTIRVGRGTDVAMIAAIVHALKASRRSGRPALSG